jgi:hypothetical protein
MLRAEQKIRQRLTGNPHKEPYFRHEGPNVVRWLTGGTVPDAYVTFQSNGSEIIAHCPTCGQEVGRFGTVSGAATYQQIATIRERAHKHSEQHRT